MGYEFIANWEPKKLLGASKERKMCRYGSQAQDMTVDEAVQVMEDQIARVKAAGSEEEVRRIRQKGWKQYLKAFHIWQRSELGFCACEMKEDEELEDSKTVDQLTERVSQAQEPLPVSELLEFAKRLKRNQK